MNKLEQKGQAFIEEVWSSLGVGHPLANIFAGLMLVYYADESDLQWVEFALRPWVADAERKSEEQEREIVLAALWILTASIAKTINSKSRKET
jgi:hypothetical protein